MQTLTETAVPVPGVVGIDEKGDTLGVTGYVMNRVVGTVPPPTYHRQGLFFDASAADRSRMALEVMAAQAKLHAVDCRKPALDFLLARGKGATALERDLDWTWASLCWGCPGEVEQLESVRRWFLEHQPRESTLCLCHGDAMLANYMFRDNRVLAILDWELAFLGNPANDVAYQVLTHDFLALGGEPLAGFPTEQERPVPG